MTPISIAEIGCNHMGDINIAIEMIKVSASFCKADIIKFQKRTPKELLNNNEYNMPHPNPENSFGKTYGEHREFLEFDIEQHEKLKYYCERENVIYSSSVWDLTSAKEICTLNPKMIKIPSACNLDFNMLKWIIANYQGEIHLSLGMTTHDEEDTIFRIFSENNRNKDLVLYSCTSGYPVPFDDICLLEINRIRNKFNNLTKAIGFSGHHLGIAADIAALTLGAEYFERHFTLDRTWKGTDHSASLEPDGLRKLIRDLKNVSLSLKYKEKEILDIEMQQRIKLKRKIK